MTTALAQPQVQPRFTPEDVVRLDEQGLYELVDGQLVEKSMSSLANKSAGLIIYRIAAWCVKAGGDVLPEQSIQCFPIHPELVRRPDVAYFGPDKSPRLEEVGNVTVAPDLAVEVISPNDRIDDLEEKIAEYLTAGVKVVWAVNPKFRWVRVHRIDAPLVEFREDAHLTAEDILPGFSVSVRDILPARRQPQTSA